MLIRRKSSLKKINYKKLSQLSFFGHDNLSFKTINLPKAQRFDNLCNKFKLKKIITNTFFTLPIILISK